MKKRKTYSGMFKAQVVLELIRGRTSLTDLAARTEVHPNQIKSWESAFLQQALEEGLLGLSPGQIKNWKSAFLQQTLEKGHLGLSPDRPLMGPPGWERREERPIPEHSLWRNLRTLGLDKNQRERWREIESRLRKEEIRKRADLEVTRFELQEILDKEPVDLKAVEGHLKKMEALVTGIHLASIKAREEIKALLTSPQKEALKNFQPMGPRGEGLLPGQRRMPPPGEEEEEGPGGKPGSPGK